VTRRRTGGDRDLSPSGARVRRSSDEIAHQKRVLALVSVASACSALDLSLMFVAYPSIRADFSSESLSLVSWVLTSFTIVAAALLIPAGRIADRVGRRRIFLTALALFTTGSAACAVAPSVPMLIGARVVQAVGGAMLTPSALAIIMSTISAHRRAWAIGVWSTITGAISTAAPTIGAALVKYASWRWAFVINIPLGVTAFFAARRMIDESVDPDAGPLPDPIGVVLIMGGVAALAYGVVQSSTWGWGDRGTLVALGTAALLVAWFVHRCATQPSPVIDLRVFRPFVFKANAVAAVAIGITFWGGYYVFIQFLTVGWGYSVMGAGLLLIPMTLVASFVGVPAGRLMDRRGHRVVMAPAALAFVLSMLWLRSQAGDDARILTVWLPAALLAGLTNAVCFTGVNSAGARTAPPEALGVTAGIVQTIIRVGGAVGSALGIALVGDATHEQGVTAFQHAFEVLAVVGLVAMIAMLPLATTKHRLPSGVTATDSLPAS
jgi:EmrB/QacA subfamily drug resistance transporter